MHCTVEQVLRCYVTERQTDWDLLLLLCEFVLNSTKSASTGYTPAMVLYAVNLYFLLNMPFVM